jgi:hypothetical protein
MSSCMGCARNNFPLQKAFPARPCFDPPIVVNVTIPMDASEQVVPRAVLHELN